MYTSKRKRFNHALPIVFMLFLLLPGTLPAAGVKITPLGSHAGEVCRFDRALLPEDPDGTRTGSFIAAANMPVHVPLNGKTMTFDASGQCTTGCAD